MLEYTSRAFQNRVVCCLSCPVGANPQFPSRVQKREIALYVFYRTACKYQGYFYKYQLVLRYMYL